MATRISCNQYCDCDISRYVLFWAIIDNSLTLSNKGWVPFPLPADIPLSSPGAVAKPYPKPGRPSPELFQHPNGQPRSPWLQYEARTWPPDWPPIGTDPFPSILGRRKRDDGNNGSKTHEGIIDPPAKRFKRAFDPLYVYIPSGDDCFYLGLCPVHLQG